MKALTALVATLALGALFLSTPAQAQTETELNEAIQAQLDAGLSIDEAAAAVAKLYPAKASTITGLATAMNTGMAADIVEAVFKALEGMGYDLTAGGADASLAAGIKDAAIAAGGDSGAINNVTPTYTPPPTGGGGTGGTGGTGTQSDEQEIQDDIIVSEEEEYDSPT